MSAEMEQLLKEFEKFQSRIQQAQQQFAGLERMKEELGELESVATSPDGSIRVVAGPGGAIKDIQLSQEALRQQASSLSAGIMATLNRAVAAAARKQAKVVESHMGDMGGAISEQVLQAQAEAFGVSVEELRRADEEPAPTTPAGQPQEMQFGPTDEPAPEPSRPEPPRPQAPPRPAPPPSAPGPYGAGPAQGRPAGPPPQQRPPAPPRRRVVDFDDDEEEGFGSVFER
ncbi:MAG: YbaB/EbfC family nucleoid-associated protein [Thermocrispum agreste]|uniref:YbaB/EbfC family nucleoid-associated protein n=2 Tax=Thermocrispum TaxID=37924 RepID=A0ABD6FI31_9PSEU